MIRVLQFIGSIAPGDTANYIMDVYRRIDRQKIQFDFVLDSAAEGPLYDEACTMGASFFTMPAFNGLNGAEVKREWNNFFYLHPEYKLLHCHAPGYASLFFPLGARLGVKTIVHCHGDIQPSGPAAMAKTALLSPLKKQADVLMADSRESAVWLFGEKALKSENYFFMPRVVELEAYRLDLCSRRSMRRELGLEKSFIVGYCGPFWSEAALHLLVDSFSLLKEKKPEAALLLVGDGPMRINAARYALEKGVAEDVILSTETERMRELLWAMDVFACPEKDEALPYRLIQAQAAGLSCIVNEDTETELYVSPTLQRINAESPLRWAKAMEQAGKRQDVSDKIILAARDSGSAAETLSALYLRLYRNSTR